MELASAIDEAIITPGSRWHELKRFEGPKVKSLGIGVDGLAFLMDAGQLSAGVAGEPYATEVPGVFVWATVTPAETVLAHLNRSATVYLQAGRQISAQQAVQGSAVFAMKDNAGHVSALGEDALEIIGWSVVQALVASIESDTNHEGPAPSHELLLTAS